MAQAALLLLDQQRNTRMMLQAQPQLGEQLTQNEIDFINAVAAESAAHAYLQGLYEASELMKAKEDH